MTLAALYSTLRLYENPDTLSVTFPTLKFLTRSTEDIRILVDKIAPAMSASLAGIAQVDVVECKSQIGSGALPVDLLPSWGVSVVPLVSNDRQLQVLNAKFRNLEVPLIGRVSSGRLIFDFRCLEEPELLLAQLKSFGESNL